MSPYDILQNLAYHRISLNFKKPTKVFNKTLNGQMLTDDLSYRQIDSNTFFYSFMSLEIFCEQQRSIEITQNVTHRRYIPKSHKERNKSLAGCRGQIYVFWSWQTANQYPMSSWKIQITLNHPEHFSNWTLYPTFLLDRVHLIL